MERQKHHEELVKKYSFGAALEEKKEMRLPTGADRNRAMGIQGKPKDLKKTINRLLRYLAHEQKLMGIAIFCTVLNTIATLTGSYLLRPIMNTFIHYEAKERNLHSRVEGLMGALILLAAIYLIAASTQWIQQRLMLSLSQQSLKQLRRDLYQKLETLPMKYFDHHSTGDIMSRFTNDVDVVGEMLNTTLIQLISGLITIMGTVILMLATNWILGLITIVVTPLLVFVSRRTIKKGRSAYARQQKNLGMLNGFTEEIISGQKVVKVFNHEEIAVEEFAYLNQELNGYLRYWMKSRRKKQKEL